MMPRACLIPLRFLFLAGSLSADELEKGLRHAPSFELLRESGSQHGPEAAEAGILALLKEVFKPGTLAGDQDWYRGKPEFSSGSVAADTKLEKYRRATMSEFKEITKDKEISFIGFQKLCLAFPEFASLFDFGVREFDSCERDDEEAAQPGSTKGSQMRMREPVAGFERWPAAGKNWHERWPAAGKKSGTVPCMYCEAELPHKKIPASCLADKDTTALGYDLPMQW